MKPIVSFLLLFSLTLLQTLGQQGPFSPDDWPATVDPDKEVHYVVSDRDAVFEPAGGQWFEGCLLYTSPSPRD